MLSARKALAGPIFPRKFYEAMPVLLAERPSLAHVGPRSDVSGVGTKGVRGLPGQMPGKLKTLSRLSPSFDNGRSASHTRPRITTRNAAILKSTQISNPFKTQSTHPLSIRWAINVFIVYIYIQ